jgi:hypothetical protein
MGMNAQRGETTSPTISAEVVTSPVRPERLDGITFTGQSRDSLNPVAQFGRDLGCQLKKGPARKTSSKTLMQSSKWQRPSAPSLSGIPGAGVILF